MKTVKNLLTLVLVGSFIYACTTASEKNSSANDSTKVKCDSSKVKCDSTCVDSTKCKVDTLYCTCMINK